MKYNEITKSYYDLVPWVNINLKDYDDTICESTYKELTNMIDPNFLDQNIRASALKNIHFQEFDGNIMVLSIDSSTGNGSYRNLFQFPQFEEVVRDTSLKPIEAARLLIWVDDVKLHCTCPSFLYHGYEYLLTVLDSSIIPEDRKPRRNNPGERGICCKHLNRTLKAFPFYATDIAKEIKRLRG